MGHGKLRETASRCTEPEECAWTEGVETPVSVEADLPPVHAAAGPTAPCAEAKVNDRSSSSAQSVLRPLGLVLGASTIGAVVAVAARAWSVTRRKGVTGSTRQLVVTVNRPIGTLQERALPEQLLALGDDVELELRPAPGDKGTEIAARIPTGQPTGVKAVVARLRGDERRQQVRRALREGKSVIETGEVLEGRRARTTERTLLGAPLGLASRLSAGEGQL